MRPGVLLADVGIAIVAAIVVLTITPGLAVASIIAIAVLTACALSFRRESRRRRRARDARRRAPRPPGRAGPSSARRSNRT
jgi:Flp pilus assembly protein TadB